MNQTPSPSRTARPLPTTIWLPPTDRADTAPAPGQILPAWAHDKIRTEYTRRPGHPPAPVIRISIRDTGPGMDARTPCTTDTGVDSSQSTGPARVLLAELHPDTLPTTANSPSLQAPSGMPGAMEDAWPGFFHRAHRLLPDHGVLLLATRQCRDAGVLTDPLGALIACARTAGFRYVQHIVIAHARPVERRLDPELPTDASPGVAHSDLLVLTAIRHG
ncbi:hypothetical protein [Streptomyces sp. NPDC002851]